jgi:hypothetical protein
MFGPTDDTDVRLLAGRPFGRPFVGNEVPEK